MGRTIPSATMNFLQEEASFGRFRRALRRSDQVALDELFSSAKQHLAAAQYASHALPFETLLLSMLLEEHKHVMRLRVTVETLVMESRLSRPSGHPAAAPTKDPGFGFDDDPQGMEKDAGED